MDKREFYVFINITFWKTKQHKKLKPSKINTTVTVYKRFGYFSNASTNNSESFRWPVEVTITKNIEKKP